MRKLLILILALPLIGAQDAKETQALILHGATVYTISGEVISNATILIQDGKIAAIEKDVEPQTLVPANTKARIITLKKGSVIVPGFTDLHTHLGSQYEMNETTEAFTPHVKALDAFTSDHPAVKKAVSSGVTRIVIAPGNMNVVSGQPSLLRLNGDRLDRVILDDSLGLKLSFTPEAFAYDREPTSAAGAIRMLEERLRDKTTPEYRALIKEKKLAFLHARTAAEILRAVKLAETFNLRAVLVHADEVARVLERVKTAKVAVAFGPLTINDTKEFLATPARLAKEGIPFAFISDAPGTSEGHLRVGAALAVKYGLDRKSALEALTIRASEILGRKDAGVIKKGKAADLVVLSGRPISLTSDVTHVVSNGKLSYEKGGK